MKADRSIPEIILIEDNPYDGELIMRAVTKNRAAEEVLYLNDGAEALGVIRVMHGQVSPMDNKPALIFLAFETQKIGGIELLKELKSHDATKEIPVVILLASKWEEQIQECFDHGANGIIVRPVEYERLRQVLCETESYWLNLDQR